MNIERYITTWPDGVLQRGECFPVLDMYACLQYHTAESAGFSIDRVSKSGFVHAVKGHLDVHHPCTGHIKLQMLCRLPVRHLELAQMRQIVQQTLAALDIPADETYSASFVIEQQHQVLEERVNREGIVDRI